MGDANASIPTVQPIIYKHMFGAHGAAKYDTCITFVSQASLDNGIKEKLVYKKKVVAVKKELPPNIGKKILNSTMQLQS